MEAEGVVHALRNVHKALRPGGLLIDAHPVVSLPPVEAAGVVLGRLDDADFGGPVQAAEDGLVRLVDEGLLEPVGETWRDVLERFDSADELLETVGDWEHTRIPDELPPLIRSARPPFDVRERLVYRFYRRV